jgi:hypothetical protein
MNDTHLYAKRIQQQVYLKMTEQDRYRVACELSDALILIAKNDIQNKNPDITPVDLKIETFKRMYRHEYSVDELNEIISNMRLKS